MRLKNYNEDLVLETVKIVLRDREDVQATRAFVLDVAAYALNRIPPKYITSERGLTRELIQAGGGNGNGEEGERLLNVIELITLVNRAVDVVVRRRRDNGPARPAHRSEPADDADLHLTYFYNMPHIFGRIVDAGDRTPVIAAEATLWINERVSVPAEPGWRNPYTTNEQTKGYFSFWRLLCPRLHQGRQAPGHRNPFAPAFLTTARLFACLPLTAALSFVPCKKVRGRARDGTEKDFAGRPEARHR
jgi:hypothetical protein